MKHILKIAIRCSVTRCVRCGHYRPRTAGMGWYCELFKIRLKPDDVGAPLRTDECLEAEWLKPDTESQNNE